MCTALVTFELFMNIEQEEKHSEYYETTNCTNVPHYTSTE